MRASRPIGWHSGGEIMPDPTPLPESPADRQARIKQEAERQRQAIRANGIKEGYGKRDADWFKELGVKSMEEAKELFQLRQRPTLSEEQKHGRHRFWQGASLGSAVTAIILGTGFALYTLALTGGVLSQAVPMRAQQQIADQIAAERAEQYRINGQ